MTARSALNRVHDLYSSVEFDRWVGRNDLNDDERFLINRYLAPTAATLEAGTGGGRILLALKELGFGDLRGFDFVPGLVESARAADASGSIRFDVEDAGNLSYADNAFDQIIYLQQLLSCIDRDDVRASAIQEAYRVLRPGGVALFSVLCYEVRRKSLIYRNLLRYWRVLRWLRGAKATAQATPWMRLGNKLNPRALLDREPYVYWFRLQELVDRLTAAGFEVRSVGTSAQLRKGAMFDRMDQLDGQTLDGALYCVAAKPMTPAAGKRTQ